MVFLRKLYKCDKIFIKRYDGPRGKQGRDGPAGPAGSKGQKGAPGYAGTPGQNGAKVISFYFTNA